jgi:hypothetical protein
MFQGQFTRNRGLAGAFMPEVCYTRFVGGVSSVFPSGASLKARSDEQGPTYSSA